MVKTRKKPKHRIKGRQPPKKKSKSSSSSVKWILIFSAIAVVGVAAIWGAKSLFQSFPNTQNKKPAVSQKSTSELESAALKKTEMKLVQAVIRDFPNNEAALKLVADFGSNAWI
jgi:cytoskeletal protein RodZ